MRRLVIAAALLASFAWPLAAPAQSAMETILRFRPAPQPPATAVHFENLTVAFPRRDVAIATGQVVATGSNNSRIYIVSFSDTFCRRHNRWLAVHAQETLAAPNTY